MSKLAARKRSRGTRSILSAIAAFFTIAVACVLLFVTWRRPTPAVRVPIYSTLCHDVAWVLVAFALFAWQELRVRRARKQVVAANVTKGQFLANISHEIRTPMNGVIGLTEIALAQDMTDDLRTCLSSVRQSAHSLLRLLNDLLDFSNIEAGKLQLQHVRFSPRQAVEEALAPLMLEASHSGLALCLDWSDGIPKDVYGDPFRIQQVLTNLVGNAIKFTPKGEIHVSCRMLRQAGNRTLLRIAVRDTGIGISPDKTATLFQAFTQADGSTTRQFGGTGLGLTISRELVHLLGGDISVESRLDAGSIFWFTFWLDRSTDVEPLPVPSPPASAPEPFVLAEAVASEQRVLLAEDNKVNQMVATRLLEKLGCRVDVAPNGQVAVELWKSGKYRLIFMDCQMPELDGYEATRRIRSLEVHNRRIPIIALTANAMTGDRERCLDSGMDDYIAKPVEMTELMRAIHQWCGQPDLTALANAVRLEESATSDLRDRQRAS